MDDRERGFVDVQHFTLVYIYIATLKIILWIWKRFSIVVADDSLFPLFPTFLTILSHLCTESSFKEHWHVT